MDRYSSSRYTPTSGYRSKSPFGRPSSSMSNSSTNLRVDTDAFDALNQSLGRHDSSFVRDLNTTGSSLNDTIPSRYNPVKKSSNYDSNNNKSSIYNTSGKWKNSNDYKNHSYDLNNNSSFGQIGCGTDSDSDIELSKPRKYTTTYTTTYSSPLYDPLTGNRSNAYTTESKGFQMLATRNTLQNDSIDDEDQNSLEIDNHFNDNVDDISDDSNSEAELKHYSNVITDAEATENLTSEDSDNQFASFKIDNKQNKFQTIPNIAITDSSSSSSLSSDVEIKLSKHSKDKSSSIRESDNHIDDAWEARAWSHNSEDEEFDSVSQYTDNDSVNKYKHCQSYYFEDSIKNNHQNMHALGKTGNGLVQEDDLFHGAGQNSASTGSSYATSSSRPSHRPSTSFSERHHSPERTRSQTSTVNLRPEIEKLTKSIKSHTQTIPSTTTGVQESTSTFDLIEKEQNCVKFVSTFRIVDSEAIRAVDWHPNGKFFAVGSNSRLLRVFSAKTSFSNQDNNNNQTTDSFDYSTTPEIIYRRPKYHKGSVYCLSWNKLGNLLATGSNDKTIKLAGFDESTSKFEDCESTINVHDGTVRDLCFMDDLTNGSSVLLSAGAGNCRIYVTDCETSQSFMSLSGHSRPIHTLYTWGGATFASGSEDKTIRMWDLRSRDCFNLISCPTISRNRSGGAVTALAVDPSGRLLVSGHEDSTCMLYDIRAGRVIQTFNPHTADVRTIRFSSKAYYLLTGGSDNRIVLSNLQGDLTQSIQSVEVASHDDKIISARWHPTDFSFISASADKTAVLWTLQDYSQFD